MKYVACLNSCMFAGLTGVINEHVSMIVLGGVVGGLLGLFGQSVAWVGLGAGAGVLLAFLYGSIPHTTDCVDKCPVE